MGALDTAMKAMQGLKNAFGATAAVNVAATEAMAAAENGLSAAQAKTAATTAAETAAVNANTASKAANAAASGTVGTSGVKNLGKLATSLKSAGKVLKGILNVVKGVATGFLGWVAVAGLAFAAISKVYAKMHEEEKKRQEEENAINYEYDKQLVQLEMMVRAFQDQNTTLEQKKALGKEINKLCGMEVVETNKLTGELKINNEMLEEYKKGLRTAIELEQKRKQIAELLEKAEEAANNAANERYNLVGKWFKTEKGYLKEEKKYREEINRLLDKSVELTAQKAENDKKSSDYLAGQKKQTGGVVRTFKEIIKEVKDLYSNLIGTIYEEKSLTKVYNGIYSKTDELFDRIEEIVRSRGLGEMITKEFSQKIADKANPLIKNYEVTVDNLFGNGKVEAKEKELIDAEERLAKLIQKKKTLNDANVKKLKEEVDQLNYEVVSMKLLAESAQKYADWQDELKRDEEERLRSQKSNAKYAETEYKYRVMSRNVLNKDAAETYKNVETAKTAYEDIAERMTAARLEYAKLMAMTDGDGGLKNKAIQDRMAELYKYMTDNATAEYDARMALEDANYQARLKHIAELEEREKQSVEEIMALKQEKNLDYGYESDWNDDSVRLESERHYLEERRNLVEQYYTEQLALYQQGTQEYVMLEAEKAAQIASIDQQLAQKQQQIDADNSKKRIKIAKAYYNTYQTLTTQASNILSAYMDGMDENSKKYKALKYAQGVIDTISGTLSGFMSGVESGLPAPYNLILAAVTAASVFATGMIQLSNLKKEQLGNTTESASAASSVTSGGFGTYDTLAYQQGNDILGSIQDTRVYVVESDIQEVSNRVQVIETNSTF
jgi:hypothetical protein